MKERAKTVISYGMPAVIVLILTCIIYITQGIWPFGSETVDFYDMAQQVAAESAQVWDEMHGVKSMVFDWYTLLGRDIPGGTYISAFNILFYFVPRNMILETFSVLLVIKMMCMATTMRIFLKKEAKNCPEFFGIVLAAGYGLCGFVLMQYTIMNWMDLAVLIPLAFMYTKRVLQDGQMCGLIVTITLMLINSFYIPVMMIMFIFLMTGLYIASLKITKSDKQPHILRLGIAMISSLLLSAFVWIPKVLSSSGSARYNNEAESGIVAQYMKILSSVKPDYATRWWVLLGVSFAAAITLVGLIKDLRNKEWGRIVFVAGGFVFLFAELLFENIQLMWHFGSYVNYPVRNGFLFYMMFATCAAIYIPELVSDNSQKARMLNICAGGALIISIAFTAMGLFWYQSNAGMSVYDVFRVSMLCAIVSFFVYMFLILFKKGHFLYLAAFIVAGELVFYGVLLIGKPLYITGYAEEFEQEGEYVRIAGQLLDKMDIYPSSLDRIKNPDESLNTNYGDILRRATLSGWFQGTSYDKLGAAANMGYSTQYTRLLDAGGNVFTDALIHVTQVLTFIPQDESMYEKTQEAEAVIDHVSKEVKNYGLYNCKYVLPFGNTISSESKLEDIKNASGVIDFSNAVYAGICPDAEDGVIAQRVDYPFENELETFEIEGKKALYITANHIDSEYKNLEFYVNDEAIKVPSIHEGDNTYYSAHFNNNSVLLGCFENETVKLNVKSNTDEYIDEEGDKVALHPESDILLYTIDLDKLNHMCSSIAAKSNADRFVAKKRSLECDVTGQDGEYLLLPIGNSNSFDVLVNGKKEELLTVNGLLSAVRLNEGENHIEISIFPKMMKYGIYVSIASLLAILILMICVQYVKVKKTALYEKMSSRFSKVENGIEKYLPGVYLVAWSLVVIGMYVVPLLYGVWYYISEVL